MLLIKMQKAQASLEYFIIFAVIAGITLLSVSTFLNRTRTSSQNLYSKAVGRILNSQALTSPPTPTSTPAPTSTPTPPGARLLTLNNRNVMSFPVGETDFICRLEERPVGSVMYRIHMDIIGLTNETEIRWTWTFPDGTVKTGYTSGTDVYQPLDVRSASPIPAGDSILKITVIAPSNVVLWVQY